MSYTLQIGLNQNPYLLDAEKGNFYLMGYDYVPQVQNVLLVASPGAYSLIGQALSFPPAAQINAVAGAYILGGQAVTLAKGGTTGTLVVTFPSEVPLAVGTPFYFTVTATGGTGGYTWTASGGIGSIDSAGNWSGTPGSSGTFIETINVSDGVGNTGQLLVTCDIS